MTASYQVEIRIKSGISRVDAISKMAELFHVSTDKLEHTFSNNDSVFKHGLDLETAKKYQLALESCGCICMIEPDSQFSQNSQATKPYQTQQEQSVDYPKVYQPSTIFRVLFGSITLGAICIIYLVLFKNTISYEATSDFLILKILPVFLSLGFVSILGFQTVGYSVTLMPDSIRIKTLLGLKVVEKKDIKSHRVALGKTTTLFLTTNSSQSIAIPFNFKLDDDFNNWFKDIPTTGLSLETYNARLVIKDVILPKPVGVIVSFVVAGLGAVILAAGWSVFLIHDIQHRFLIGAVIFTIGFGISGLALNVWSSTFNENGKKESQAEPVVTSEGKSDYKWLYIVILILINLQVISFTTQRVHQNLAKQKVTADHLDRQ